MAYSATINADEEEGKCTSAMAGVCLVSFASNFNSITPRPSPSPPRLSPRWTWTWTRGTQAETVGGHLVQLQLKSPSSSPSPPRLRLGGLGLDSGDLSGVRQVHIPPLHNVHFGYYVYLPTEQAETYLKSCVLINYSTYICLCLFGWKVNMILKETVTFKL